MYLVETIEKMAVDARTASRQLRKTGSEQKNDALKRMARMLVERREEIIAENRKDLAHAKEVGLSAAMIDRLTLDDKVIQSMAEGLLEVAGLKDPVGEVTGMWKRPNGLLAGRVRIPLGVIGFIFESRPNVTVDAAALCLKSGNAVILKGGSEAIHSNTLLGNLMMEALREAGLPEKAVQVIQTTDREAVKILIGLEDHLDVIIPRGGEGLIRFVTANSRVPVLKHYKGVCHVYVDKYADVKMAVEICLQRKGPKARGLQCHGNHAGSQGYRPGFSPGNGPRFTAAGVEIRGCPETVRLVSKATPAQEADWPAEFLDLILAVKVVSGMEEALDHIEKYGSHHTEAIVTSDYGRSQRFLSDVDSSVVLINASTRFNDGGQLGLGAEIGINTSKLHAFGPMGLEELTTPKFIVYGQGQTRS